jgi:hypothetical protein
MVKHIRIWVSFVLVLLLTPLAGCGGDDDEKKSDREAGPVEGTFVGKVRDTEAFAAVVVSPAAGGQDRREVKFYVSDGRRLDEWFRGSVEGESFDVTSDDRDAKAKGKVTDKEVTGTIELPDDESVRYQATRAAATAGLYNLTISDDGEVKGSSEAGVGLTGESTLPNPGKGTLKLADGKRIEFDIRASGGDSRLRAGRARAILLADRQLRGTGKNRDDSAYYIRSSK